MKKHFFSNSTVILVFALAAMPTLASAQETPGVEGVWFSDVTPVDCQTGAVIPHGLPCRGLNMFSHDGSFTNDAAFLAPNPRRGAGLGVWQHTQGRTYTS